MEAVGERQNAIVFCPQLPTIADSRPRLTPRAHTSFRLADRPESLSFRAGPIGFGTMARSSRLNHELKPRG